MPVTVLVRADGEPSELGKAHGAALAGRLRSFVDDHVCRLGRLLPDPVTLDGLRPTIARYRTEIEHATPRLAAEVAGLASGAGLDEDEAWLLQLRREILGYTKIPTAGDCTTYARVAGPLLAQTVDLNGDLEDQIAVLDLASPIGRSLVLSFGGLLGYLGLNSRGLAIGLNLVLGGDWRAGLPPYLAIRHLLDTAEDVEEALDVLRGLRLASSRSLTLCDATRAVWVEILGDELRTVQAPQTVHTNHFLHPDFVPHDEINVFARNSSVRRLEAATAVLATLGKEPEEHLALLSAPPIRVPDNGDIRRERTVAAAVLLPELGELRLRPGDPALSTTRTFRLK
ncbi:MULTISPECIES: C45 family autoproteolytic acyltransferase/hydolase [Frankia]|uniref:Peptidase C45, acyl-coenzyme A:6-aminopenicillanic acid acyl-transferase n=1 Tax=Frankia casuarinae (strain DSM 45818 / CECT 9043 / HFP020203 / CcI3) TaxID=106370 RepID=Q2J7W6_FRACC|nr:peptidase C45, acyl-coenzyme A:6-aminopenicillanic acid acyl-transferase [Frankia casuarinae]OFB41177.1 peptidase C45 [Frankia sp. CgIM4]OHV50532.1 peptidase C45 [Frankia sp. CgIS1]